MAKLTEDMARKMNERLSAAQVGYRLVVDEYNGIEYKNSFCIQVAPDGLSPLLVGNVSYSNCSSVPQTVSQNIAKSVQASSTWTINAGINVGVSVEAESDLVFAKVKGTASTNISLDTGASETTTETIELSVDVPLTAPAQSLTTLQAIVQEERAVDIPFVVESTVIGGPLRFTRTDTAVLIRLFQTGSKRDHFYTTSEAEADTAVKNLNFKREGSIGRVFPDKIAGTIPLYRYFAQSINDHFYTTSFAELGDGNSAYKAEGIAGYVYREEVKGTIPVHRYYHAGFGDHFYTTNFNELGRGGVGGWAYEGVAFYSYPASGHEKKISALLRVNDRTFTSEGTFSGTAVSTNIELTVEQTDLSAEECNTDSLQITETAAAELGRVALLDTAAQTVSPLIL